MSASSRRESRLSVAGSNDPGATAPSHPRNTVDRLCQQSDAALACYQETPEVIEAEAAFLDACRLEMAGATKTLAGDMDEGNFRAQWRGDRNPVTVREYIRVRLLGTAEARRATDAGMSVLRSLGAEPIEISMEHALGLLGDSTGCVKALIERLDDADISKGEAIELAPVVRALHGRLGQILTTLEVKARMPEPRR